MMVTQQAERLKASSENVMNVSLFNKAVCYVIKLLQRRKTSEILYCDRNPETGSRVLTFQEESSQKLNTCIAGDVGKEK